MDVPRIIPCMPGATLDEAVDDENWKATMAVKLGPISLSFKTDVKREKSDDAARRAKLSARAREARGRGNASATIESSLTPQNGGTKVDIVTDLQLTGPGAQDGRGRGEAGASPRGGQCADGLKTPRVASPEEAAAAVTQQSRPVGGLRLGLGALWRTLGRLFRRA